MKKVFLLLVLAVFLVGCATDAAVVSQNLSTEADMFRIDRRIIFYNSITDTIMLAVEGKCSIEDQGNQLEVTCMANNGEYRKHFLGLSDNVTYFVEQTDAVPASEYRYKYILKPSVVIPDVEIRVGQ